MDKELKEQLDKLTPEQKGNLGDLAAAWKAEGREGLRKVLTAMRAAEKKPE